MERLMSNQARVGIWHRKSDDRHDEELLYKVTGQQPYEDDPTASVLPSSAVLDPCIMRLTPLLPTHVVLGARGH